jgi:hypothetical protein
MSQKYLKQFLLGLTAECGPKLTESVWLLIDWLYDGVRRLWTAATNGHIGHPQVLYEYGERRYWGKPKKSEKNHGKTLNQYDWQDFPQPYPFINPYYY